MHKFSTYIFSPSTVLRRSSVRGNYQDLHHTVVLPEFRSGNNLLPLLRWIEVRTFFIDPYVCEYSEELHLRRLDSQRIKKLNLVDIVQGRALRDLEIGEKFYIDNDL